MLEMNDGVLRENETTHQTPLEKNNVFIPFMCLPFPVHTVPAKLVEDWKWNERMVCFVEKGQLLLFLKLSSDYETVLISRIKHILAYLIK